VPRLLIVDGNTPDTTRRIIDSGGHRQSELFEQTLHRHPLTQTQTIFPADPTIPLPTPEYLKGFHGILWTGSALNVYDLNDAVSRQIELARRAFQAGTPIYGSCWGLQVAVAACNGRVYPNPKGREFGIARNITLTPAGRQHPLLALRPQSYDALAVHRDIVDPLPPAAEIRFDSGRFHGVQYHPEYSFADIAAAYRRYAPNLVEEGLCSSLEDAESIATTYQTCEHPSPEHTRIACATLNIHPELTSPAFREIEILNWLKHLESRQS